MFDLFYQETKLALYAEENAKHLAANLKLRVEKKPMKPYKPSKKKHNLPFSYHLLPHNLTIN